MSRRKTTKEFVAQGRLKYGDLFDYSETVYQTNNTKVAIRCTKHNAVFLQTPSNHLSFNGCQQCVGEAQRERFVKTTNQFIQDAQKIHGDRYDYSKVDYKTNHDKITVTCRHHGDFSVLPLNHLRVGVDCPQCGLAKLPGGYFNNYFERNPEQALKPAILYLVEFVALDGMTFYKLGVTAHTLYKRFSAPEFEGFQIRTIWTQQGPLMLVCLLEAKMKAHFKHDRIEIPFLFNGRRECFSHPLPECTIYLDDLGVLELERNKDIVASRLLVKSGIATNKLFARNGIVREISRQAADTFMTNNHIQGPSSQATVFLGLEIEGELCSVMAFGKPRFKSDVEYEIIRYATKTYTVVVGAASRLFKHFVKQYTPSTIISYSDRRWNAGTVYSILGFDFSHTTAPNYWYVKDDLVLSRIKCQKHKLPSILGSQFDPTKSERMNMLDAGFYQVFDKGNDVFVWKSPKKEDPPNHF